jgi:hypothetical protein
MEERSRPELMGMQLALPNFEQALKSRFRLPPVVPPFDTRTYRIFTILWLAAFLLAVVGPATGFYLRYSAPSNNSQLLLGSRAAFAVSPKDATRIRFTVGPWAAKEGIRPGDKIVAIYGLPLPKVMPITEEVLDEHSEDPAYIAMGNLLFGTDSADVPVTVRGADGRVRELSVTTGEGHIDAAGRALGISPKLLSFIDLLHILFYPFLLWAAWILHRRNSRDAVSSILSLAVLFTIGAEQPSSVALATAGVPRWLNVALYDLGNVLLLTGILLFPHGRLSWRVVGLILCLPALFFLQGMLYQALFAGFMVVAVLMLLRCLRQTESGELHQQIRWALLGFSGYALLRGLSIIADMMKSSVGSFGQQLLVEMAAGISLGIAVLLLQMGLLIALLRYRLYDAEVVISRSANFALITLAVAAVFAAAADALKQIVYNFYGNTGSEGPVVIAAALATVLVNPIQERIHRWSEKKFQKNLFLLRDDLPELVRDMRETASLREMVDAILEQVDQGVRAVRSAMIVNGNVLRVRGLTLEEAEAWRSSKFADDYASDICEASDKIFPIRVPLVPSSGDEAPVGFLLVGPRPDGSVPSRDEQKALAGVSEPIGRAIRTVIKREAHERQMTQLIEANTQRIEQLEALLGAGPAVGRKRPPRTA